MGFLAMLTVPQAERYAHANPPVEEWDGEAMEVAYRDFPNGGYKLFYVLGTGSMEPTLTTDDRLVSVRVPFEELKEGEIVTYKPSWAKDGQVITHRLVQKDKGGWILSGDANKRSESFERMTPEKYLGKVVKIIRKPKKESK